MTHYHNPTPANLTISPTYKCTAECRNCCLRCSPRVSHIMDIDTICSIIDQACQTYPSIEMVIFTGGECFLLGEDLAKAIAHVTSYGKYSRVVTNAFWARTYESAYKRLEPLIKAGLSEINFSTGDNHQEYVPLGNIINAVQAASDLNLFPIAINVETHPTAAFDASVLENHETLRPLIETKKLNVLRGSWVRFSTQYDEIEVERTIGSKKPCPNILTDITVSPNMEMMACCGLTTEYNPYLKLGNLKNCTMQELWDRQFQDIFKLWLATDGPEEIYFKLYDALGLPSRKFNHDCAYCLELITSEEKVKALKQLCIKEKDSILFKSQLHFSSLDITNS